MANGQILVPRRRRPEHDYRDLASKGAYSVIFVVLTLIAIRPLMVRHMLDRADAYADMGLTEDSRRQCNKALLLDEDNTRAWYRLAHIYNDHGDREMAYDAYQRATDADVRNVPAHFELGSMYAHDGRHQMAIPYLEQVRKLGPAQTAPLGKQGVPYHRAALEMLILCYDKVGDATKAEFTLKELRVFYPHYVRTNAHLAQLENPGPE